MSTMIEERPVGGADPIDALIPPPRPWWFRLIAGAVTVGAVGTVAFLWGFGYLYPRPECCGEGSSASLMSLSPDGEAVTVTASYYNSSGRALTVDSVSAELPGADVLDVSVLDPDNNVYPTDNTLALPTTSGGHDFTRFLITFVPNTCVDDSSESWGRLAVGLDVAGWWSIGRSYETPVLEQRQDLSVLPPEWVIDPPQSPLAAACALLGR